MSSKRVVRYQARKAVARDFRNRIVYTEIQNREVLASPSFAGFISGVILVVAIYALAKVFGI
jgi:VIT1/CCC1 family predicted Fe2+/Mn2+ transporter